MKKFLFSLFVLSFLIPNSYAGVITYNTLTSDSGINYGFFNGGFSTIYNDYNGNIGSSNILDGSLTDADLATPVKFSNWYPESIGDWTYTGMLPATSATLSSNISAGTSYVSGARIVTNATSKTYTASKDTYVYIDKNGAFQYVEVANGASTPTTPANSLLLAKVVTNGTAITAVTDLRQLTPPNLRTYANYKSGLVVSRDPDTATVVSIGMGEVEFGNSVTNGRRVNTNPTTINFGVTGRGGLDAGSLAAGYYYLFAVPSTTNSVNFDGIASTSSTDSATVTGERLIGWCYAPDTTHISPDSIGAYRGLGGDAPNIVLRSATDTVTTTSANWPTLPGMDTKFVSSGRPIKVSWVVNNVGASTNTNPIFALNFDNVRQPGTTTFTTTTAAQGDGWTRWNEAVGHTVIKAPAGTHNVNLTWAEIWAQTSTAVTRDMVIEEL